MSSPSVLLHAAPGSRTLEGPPPSPVVTIGNFDGVHLGHQEILRGLSERARELGGTSCLLTFDPPPSRVVGGRRPVPQIATLGDRQWLAAEAGLDLMVIEPFTPELAAWTPEMFVRDLLHARLKPVELWVGYDFQFGRNREGDVHFLRGWFASRGCWVRQLHAITDDDGGIISSTRIRAALIAGEVESAARLLGRPHFVRGTVVQGDQRGRTLGFPTANLAPETELLPAHGVYATWTSVDGQVHPGVTNVGRRPTFGGGEVRLETHLFDVSLDLYGREATVWFHTRLRAERPFPGPEALVAQIQEDVAAARLALASAAPHPLIARSTRAG